MITETQHQEIVDIIIGTRLGQEVPDPLTLVPGALKADILYNDLILFTFPTYELIVSTEDWTTRNRHKSQHNYLYSQPKNKSSKTNEKDCMIRSVAIATGCDYDLVASIMQGWGWTNRRRHEPTVWMNQILCTLIDLGYYYEDIMPDVGRTVNSVRRDVCHDGVYLVSTNNHICCIKDSIIYDTWNPKTKYWQTIFKVVPLTSEHDLSTYNRVLRRLNNANYKKDYQ